MFLFLVVVLVELEAAVTWYCVTALEVSRRHVFLRTSFSSYTGDRAFYRRDLLARSAHS